MRLQVIVLENIMIQLKINDLRIKGGTKEISVQVANLTKFLAASVIPGCR
jgi:hypothetical protein